jgi:hypothetical protein
MEIPVGKIIRFVPKHDSFNQATPFESSELRIPESEAGAKGSEGTKKD